MRRAFIIIALCALVACAGGGGKTPVINKSPYRVIPAATKALPGDSLYSVAWRFGLDYQKIAKWNHLKRPYAIQPGQVIRLRQHAASAPAKPPAAAVSVSVAAPAKALAKSPAKLPGTWQWPAQGKLTGKYAPATGSNGIQITGAEGSAIQATAAGQVVYAGEGLRGYGKLIIVKHSPRFLSAYAHNRDILVKEGQAIKSGQQIARMGSSGAQTTMLHFEIREDGKPVDPLKYLK